MVVRPRTTGCAVVLSTGNYHARTAMQYTISACSPATKICADVNDVFMQLTGLGKAGSSELWQSPFTLHSQVLRAVRREAGRRAPESPPASSPR